MKSIVWIGLLILSGPLSNSSSTFIAKPDHTLSRVPASTRKAQRASFLKVQEHKRDVYQKMAKYPHTSVPIKEDYIKEKYGEQNKEVTSSNHKLSAKISLNGTQFSASDELIVKVVLSKDVKVDRPFIILNKEKTFLKREASSSFEFRTRLNHIAEGNHLIEVYVRNGNSEVRQTLGFRVQEHFVAWVDTVSTEIDSVGDLVFTNRFDFVKKGNYLVSGVVVDDNGKAFSKISKVFKDVKEGRREIGLTLYGKNIVDQKVSGKIKLRNIEVVRIGENLASTGNYFKKINQETNEIFYDQFRSDDFNDQIMLSKLANNIKTR